jgi:hypothetical protein
VSGVAGQIEENLHRVLTEDGGIAGGRLKGGRRLPEPVVEHRLECSCYSSPWIWALR